MAAFAAGAGFLLLAVIALSLSVFAGGSALLFALRLRRVVKSKGAMGFWDF